MAEIDSLDIQIQTSAKKANTAIGSLVKKLDILAASIGKINGNTINGLTNGVDRLSAAIQAMKSVDAAGLAKLSKNIEKLGNSNVTGIDSAAASLSNIKNALSGFESVSANSAMLGDLVKTISKLSSIGESASTASGNLPKIGSSINKMVENMSGIGTIDSGVNRFLSSVARLASAGDKSTVVAEQLPRIGNALKDSADKIKSIEGISDSVNSFTQAIAQLASAGDKAEKTASGLNTLSQSTLEFFNTMKDAPRISENTIRMTEALAQLSNSGGKVSASIKPAESAFSKLSKTVRSAVNVIKKSLKTLGVVLSGTFSKIGQIGLNAANTIKKVAGSMVAAFSKIHHSSKGLKTVSSNLGSLAKAFVGFKGIQGLFNFGKTALELGSGITEVENVVDTAFGMMRQHAYDFASTATEQFGLSELAAKQYSGTMMAMLKSSGVAQSQAAKMSTTIAGLAGDIASFYNIDTDEAFYKLRSAISGETEPMKALGVNMNIVNLEAFAMSRGINKAYKDMSLAEQATLRYEYILAKTTDAQGDFAKTAGTYANQIRLLKLNIESVSAVFGQGLIEAILPAVKALNALMGVLMKAAEAFRNFMYTLMGKKIKSISSGFSGIGDSAGNLSDLGDAAAEAGDKMKKKLFSLPIDELNILSDELGSAGSAGNASGGSGGMEDFGEIEEIETETPVNEWAKRIREAFLAEDWEALGGEIAAMLNAGLQKVYDVINWDNVGPHITYFVDAFTRTLNSLVDNFDWDLLGRTVGAGINTLTNTFNMLLEGINFDNLGSKLSEGLRGAIGEVNWQNLGNLIGNCFMVAWRIAEGFVEDMWRINPETLMSGWAELGTAIGNAVNGIFEKIDFARIAKTLTDGFRGIMEVITYALNTIDFRVIADKINAGLEALYNGLNWEAIGEQITAFTAAVSKAFNDLMALDFGMIGQVIGAGITDIVRAFNQLTGEGGIDFELLGSKIADGLRGLFTEIPWEEFGNVLGNGFMIGWRILDGFVTNMSQQSGAGLTGWEELGISLGNAVNGIFDQIDFGQIGTLLSNGFNGAIQALKNFIATVQWEDVAINISAGINNFIHGVKWADAGATLSDFVVKLLGVFQDVAQQTDWEALGKGIGEFLSSIDWGGILGTVFDTIWEIASGLISGLLDTDAGKVILAIAAGMTAIKTIVGGAEIITAVGKFVGEFDLSIGKLAPIASGIVGKIGPVLGSIGSVIFSPTGLLIGGIALGVGLIIANWDKIKEAAGKVRDWVAEKWEAVKTKTQEIWGNVSGFLSDTWNNVKTWASDKFEAAKESIGKAWESAKATTKAVWDFTAKTLNDKWDSIKTKASNTWENLKTTIGNAWDKVKETTQSVWEFTGEMLSDKWESVKNKASDTWENLKSTIGTAWDNVKTKTSEVWENVTTTLGGKWENVKEKASGTWENLKTTISNGWEAVKTNTSNTWENVSTTLGNKWESVKKNASDTWENMRKKIGDEWDNTKKKTSEIWENTSTQLSNTWNTVKTNASKTWENLKSTIGTAWDNVKSRTSTSWQNISSSLRDKWNSIKNNTNLDTNSVFNTISRTWDNAKSTTIRLWDNIRSRMKSATEGMRNDSSKVFSQTLSIVGEKFEAMKVKIGNLMGGARDLVSGAIEKMKSFFNFDWELPHFSLPHLSVSGSFSLNPPSVPSFDIDWYAKGGVFDSASVIGVGEHGAEAVMPLEHNTGWIDSLADRINSRGGSDDLMQEQNSLIRELLQAVREGKKIYVQIGDRDIVSAYDRGKNRQGYSFSS